MLGDLLVSAQQAAHKWLREMILSGELHAGQALRQEEIARRLGISRLPIREALNRLATEGLVELKPRRGFYVASLNIDEIEDIFEMRAMLEARAGHLATERMTAADADAVDRCVAELDAVVDAVSPLIRILASETGELQRAQREHRLLAKHFRAGHSELVAELSREHCAYTARALIQKLRRGGVEPAVAK